MRWRGKEVDNKIKKRTIVTGREGFFLIPWA
jgi:hypothetical protein